MRGWDEERAKVRKKTRGTSEVSKRGQTRCAVKRKRARKGGRGKDKVKSEKMTREKGC